MDKEITGIKLCYENARSLIKEAKILFWTWNNARAISLTVLAFEELAKIELIARDLVCDGKKVDKEFIKKFTHHEAKQSQSFLSYIALQYLTKGREYVKTLLNKAKNIPKNKKSSLEQLKLQGLYVDFENNNFVSPKRLSRKTAKAIINFVNTLLCTYKSLLKRKDLEEYMLRYKESQVSPEWKDIINIVYPKNN